MNAAFSPGTSAINRQIISSFFSQERRAAARKATTPDTPNSGSQADRLLHLAPASGKKFGRLGRSGGKNRLWRICGMRCTLE